MLVGVMEGFIEIPISALSLDVKKGSLAILAAWTMCSEVILNDNDMFGE